MITLYVKTHKVTGLKYLGKTEQDPYKYLGSGKRWKREINKYGKEIETEIIFQSEDINEIRDLGLYYSKLWNVVESKNWANFIEENGSGGDTSAFRDYEEMSKKTKGRKIGPQTPEHRLNNSLGHMGQKAWNKGLLGVVKATNETKEKMRASKLGKKRGRYNLKKPPNGTKHLQGKKASCLCCKREWDLGNLAKHLRKQNEFQI
jgi:hypothetical protein